MIGHEFLAALQHRHGRFIRLELGVGQKRIVFARRVQPGNYSQGLFGCQSGMAANRFGGVRIQRRKTTLHVGLDLIIQRLQLGGRGDVSDTDLLQ